MSCRFPRFGYVPEEVQPLLVRVIQAIVGVRQHLNNPRLVLTSELLAVELLYLLLHSEGLDLVEILQFFDFFRLIEILIRSEEQIARRIAIVTSRMSRMSGRGSILFGSFRLRDSSRNMSR